MKCVVVLFRIILPAGSPVPPASGYIFHTTLCMACISILLLLDCVSVFILIEGSSLLVHKGLKVVYEPSIVCILKDGEIHRELNEDEKLSQHMHGGG